MHLKELDSIGLIKLCAADTRNDTAWQELVARVSNKIKTYLARSCRQARGPDDDLSSQISTVPEQVVEDLAEELWLRLLARECRLLKRFAGQTEEAFCAYLATMADSLAHNHYRDLRRTKRPRMAGPLEPWRAAETARGPRAPAGSDVEASFYASERIARLRHLARSLYRAPDAADRADAIFTLHFCQGRTADEIAKCPRLHCSRRTVARIIGTLKKCFEPYAQAQPSRDRPSAGVPKGAGHVA